MRITLGDICYSWGGGFVAHGRGCVGRIVRMTITKRLVGNSSV